MKYLSTKITEIEHAAPGYALLRFRGDIPVEGEPGQFVMIRGDWGVDPILPRAFSLVETGTVGAVLVRDVGVGTKLLCTMKTGDRLFVLGPLGNTYTAPSCDAKAVFVAGGVGVAPLFFLASRLTSAGISSVFLYGARTREHLPLKKQIGDLTDLIVTTEDGSEGETGLITSPLSRVLAQNPKSVVYSCGPHPMLKAVTKVAAQHGVSCQVALESPMACGVGTCKGCAVVAPDGTFKYVCSDGPVFDGSQIFGGDQ